MSLPRYPKYKDSGVEWLGEVPEHWEVLPCRAIVHERTAKNEGVKCEDYLSLMANVGVIPYAEKGDVGNKKPEDLSKCKIVTRGDLVINSMNYGIGSYGLSGYDGVCSPVYIVLKPVNEAVESRFAFRIFENRSFQTFAQSFGNGILEHRCAINWDILKSIGVGVPPINEQKAILDLLDRETGKIDELVAEQRRLMELLKEKRQAVISHAVTRGLNPDTPLKPSGIEWLGDVPLTWEVPSLGVLISKAELGGNHDSSEGNEGVPVMKMGNLDRGFIKLDKVEYLPEGTEVSESMILKDGDFLFNTRNSLDLVGKVAIWRNELSIATYNSNILRISFNSLKIESRDFMNYFFNSDLGLSQLRALAKGTTSVAAIYYKDLTSLRVMLPPAIEQLAIAKHLDDACAKLDTLTTEAQRAIDLLQERRTALISAAVTGQIDVRQLTPSR